MVAHQFLLSWRVLSAPKELSCFPNLLYAVSLSLSVCCSEAVHLALSCFSGGETVNIGVHSMCFREWVSSASSYAAILDSPPY